MNLKSNLSNILLALATSLLWHGAQAQVLQLTPLATFGTNGNGSILPGERPYLTDGSTNSYAGSGGRHELQRSLAYNPVTGHVLVASRTNVLTGGSYNVAIIDGQTGADVSVLDTPYVDDTQGDTGFGLNLIAVADDGAIYVPRCCLAKAGSGGNFILYRWDSESSPMPLFPVFLGDPANGNTNAAGNNNWGFTLAVRGAGINTKVLLSSKGNLVALMTPTGIRPMTSAVHGHDAPDGCARRQPSAMVCPSGPVRAIRFGPSRLPRPATHYTC